MAAEEEEEESGKGEWVLNQGKESGYWSEAFIGSTEIRENEAKRITMKFIWSKAKHLITFENKTNGFRNW